MKWLKRIIAIILTIVLGAIVFVGAWMFIDSQFGASAQDVTNIEITTEDGETIYAYLAQPEEEGTYPGIIMVHEWWGLTAEITEMAERLAEEGYVVIAPDTYRNKTASTVPGALFLRLTVPEDRVDADMQSAYDYLLGLDNVDNASVGVIGFCYGGGVALRHSVQNPDILATINLYGDTIANPDEFGALAESGQPLLGIFGAEDVSIPLEEVNAFENALNDADIPNTISIYDGVGHAFVNPTTIDEGGAAAEAWQEILNFFETNVKNTDA